MKGAMRLRDGVLRRWWRLGGALQCQAWGVQLGEEVVFYGLPILSRMDGSSIRIGARVVLCSHSRFTALGVSRPVILRTLSPSASIEIGDDTGLSGVVIASASSVRIGRECLLGADVQITDTDFHPIAPAGRRRATSGASARPVAIGDNVFLGAGTRVLKGVSIGDNSVIGAGSVVVGDLPANVVAAGVPARVIRLL